MTTFSPVLRPLLSADVMSTGVVVAARRGVWLALAVVAVCQVWLVSAGHWTYWPMYSDRYDRLASAFAAGQTHLTIAADPALLALADPYDPVANEGFRKMPGVHDACLHKGKLYYYWGPTPALLLTPGKLLLGERFAIADHYLCFGFAMGIAAVSALTLLRIRSENFPDAPPWLPAVGVLVAGLSTPITCIMTRSAVYEVAILGGQFFLLSGVHLAWRGIAKTSVPERTRLLSAGICLAAAVGSRVSLAIAVVGVGIVVIATIFWRVRRQPSKSVRPVLCFVLPLVAAAAAICVYNAVRFDHPLQFGQKYQLAGANLLALPGLFGIDNLWPNLWSYFVRPIAGLGHFPYVIAVQGFGQFPSFISIPPGYEIYEPISGLPWVMPVLLLIPIAAIKWILGTRQSQRDADIPATSAGETPAPQTREYVQSNRWLCALLVLAAVLGFVPVLLMIGSSQRYLADFTPSLVIVAMVAVLHLADLRHATPRQSRRWLSIFAALSLVTVVTGVLIAIEGYGAHFRLKNPDLFQNLAGAQMEHASDSFPTDVTHAKH